MTLLDIRCDHILEINLAARVTGRTIFSLGNVSITLRDYGRFFLFVLNDGVVYGTSLLPEGWRNEAVKPAGDSPQCNYGMLILTDSMIPHAPYT